MKKTEKAETMEKLMQLQKEIEFFSSAAKCDILDSSCTAEYVQMIKKKKEQYVKEIHKREIKCQTRTRANGTTFDLWVSKPNGMKNYISSSTYEGLIDKLYEFYVGGGGSLKTKDIFKNALRWKAETTNISGKSLKEYKRLWDTYYNGSAVADRNIHEITGKEWKQFFIKKCREHSLTRKGFSQIRIVTNLMMAYCVEEGILSYNVIRDIDFENLPFKDEAAYNSIKAKPFTDSQLQDIMEWCKKMAEDPKRKPLYYLAIQFNVWMGLRYAELCGLMWKHVDFDEDIICVSGQVLSKITMNEDLTFKNQGKNRVEHMKSHEKSRVIPLPAQAKDVLTKIKMLGLSDTYVFPTEGNFRYHTYNSKIKEAAEAVGLDPTAFHTHCLRATAATNIYKKSHDIRQVQYVLGHTTPEMSQKYVDDWWTLEAVRKTMAAND